MDIQNINSGLVIKKVDGLKWKWQDGYLMLQGYAFWHPSGWVAFDVDGVVPYIPAGGKKALEEIQQAGGFVTFEGMHFAKPMEQ